MKIANDVTELIGGTPLVRLNRVAARPHAAPSPREARVPEPGNSVKDRIGLAMIEAAERDGDAHARGRPMIVEPTSGNTGIALAFVAAVKGYRCVIVMPDTMSPERRVTMRAFGAKLVLTEGAKGMRGAIDKANEICCRAAERVHAAAIPESGQSRGALRDHRPRRSGTTPTARSTRSSPGVGTGGTITGVARCIKPKKPSLPGDRGRARGQPGPRPAARPGRTRSRASVRASCRTCSTRS